MTSTTLSGAAHTQKVRECRAMALKALAQSDIAFKCDLVGQIDDTCPIDPQALYLPDQALPGRPERPVLVSPAELKIRRVQSIEGRAVLLHAIAHIEFNAINLALDIIWRFPGMPEQFYRDWIQVAREETSHFQMLREHLQSLGYDYGDFPAHDGLWDMALRTTDDLLGRLAMVPRTLEARGLDASPPIRDKLIQAGDARAGEILSVILREEIGHVAIGNNWYHWLCEQRGLNRQDVDLEMHQKYSAPRFRGPFNLDARRAAGFDETELARLMDPKA